MELAADAAARAWEMAVGVSPDGGLSLDPQADLARRASRALGTPAFGLLARRCDVAERDLARRALAWRHGGIEGFELLETGWDPVAEDQDAAGLLAEAGVALRAKVGADAETVQGNWVTSGRLQLRLGRDFRWYPYTRSADGWEPSGSPEADPALAIADL